MAKVQARRMTVEVEGDFVVFMIGMRVNKPWKVHRWLPVFMAMPPMLRELSRKPESGFLGYEQKVSLFAPLVIQYWRSFEDLERFARARDEKHWPAWVAFNKKVGSSGDVGIWHETYKVAAGQYEAVYNNMPPHGLAKVGNMVPASGAKTSAPQRIGAKDEAMAGDGYGEFPGQ